MLKKTFSLFIFLFLYHDAFAGRVQVTQWIPWSFLKKELLKEPLNYTRSESAVHFSVGELNPTASLIHFEVNGFLDKVDINHVGIDAQSSDLASRITVTGVAIHQTVIRNVGGNQIEVSIQASCSPITIHVNRFDAAITSNFYQTRTSWDINLETVDLSFPTGQWTIAPFTCSGPAGVDQTITNLVAGLFHDPSVLETFLRDQLRPVISNQWRKSWSALLASTKGQLQNVQIQTPGDYGLHLSADIPLKTSKNIPQPRVSDSRLSTIYPQLILSTDGYQALIEDKLLAAAPQGYNLQNIPAFYNLMHNRLEQFIVWTDLRKFPTDAYFGLTTDLAHSALTLGNGSATIKAQGHVEVYKGQKKVNYIDWCISLTATLATTLKNSILTFTTGVPQSYVDWNFNQDYLNTYSYNTRVSSSILTNAIRNSFTAQTVSQTLPSLSWQGRVYKLQTLKQNGNLITMDWVR
jgi:hypothetical protein